MSENLVQSARVEEDIRAKEKAGMDETAKILERKMSWIEARSKGDYAMGVKNQFQGVYDVKARELTRELLVLKEKLSPPLLSSLQDTMLTSLQRRTAMSIEIMNGPEAKKDLYAQTSRGISFLQGASIPSLIYEHLVKHKQTEAAEFYLKSLEERGLQILPDFFPVIERIQSNELTPEDWLKLAAQTDVLGERGDDRDRVQDGIAMSALATLNASQRAILIDKVLERPNAPKIIETMIVSGYVQVAQAAEVIEARIQNPSGSTSTSTSELKALLTFVQSKEVAEAQEQVEVAKVKEMKKRSSGRRYFGESNTARELLTFKGLGGTILALNGMATVAANVLMNIHQPSQLLGNKALAYGLAMTVGGLEISNGIGGLVDTPRTNLAQGLDSLDNTAQGRKARREQERELYRKSFETDILRSPKARKIYLQFNQQINEAYKNKRLKTRQTKLTLTMEEMGLDWKKLEKAFQPLDKADTEKTISEWVSRMSNEKSHDWRSTDSQLSFMGPELERSYGLSHYELWPPERKAEYMLQSEPVVPESPETQK